MSVPSRRIQLALDASTGTLTIALGVESFLRAYDVGLAVPSQASLQAWLDAAGLALNVSRSPGSIRALASQYENDPADRATACPKGYYYTDTGYYRPTPDHATVGPDCYGFECDAGYTLDPSTIAPVCVPEYVQNWVYWTVIALVIALGLAVVLCSCALRIMFARLSMPAPSPKPESPPSPVDNTLPIGVTANGELVFEAIIESGSDTGSDSSDSDD